MLATAETVQTPTSERDPVLVWHLLAQPETCDGNCDWHAIYCAHCEDDGIALPGPTREVPFELDASTESWCTTCLARVQASSAPLT